MPGEDEVVPLSGADYGVGFDIAATQNVPKRGARRVDLRRPRMPAYLELACPANLLPAAADILAGSAAAGAWVSGVAWLVVASMCLYAGGVVFNDVFDRKLDARERPERAIPSRRASVEGATLYGSILLVAGISLSFVASLRGGLIAVAIAASALAYNAFSKHHGIAGPINMGLCRGLNLLLGMSAAAVTPAQRSFLMIFPIIYIAGITALSTGEVRGGRRATSAIGLAAMAVVLTGMPLLATFSSGIAVLWAAPFLALLAFRVLPPVWSAYQSPTPNCVLGAVKAGVLSRLDSAIATAHMGPLYGAVVLLLMPMAGLLSRTFAVT